MKLLFESSFYIWFDLKSTNLNVDERADVIADIMQKIKAKINADFPLINMDCYAKSDFKGEFYHQLELKKQGRGDDTYDVEYDAEYSAFMIDLDKSLRIVLNELFASPESELYQAIAKVDNLKIDILYRDAEMALQYIGDGKFNIHSQNGIVNTTMTFNQLEFNLENFEKILLGDDSVFEEMCAEAEKRKLETA